MIKNWYNSKNLAILPIPNGATGPCPSAWHHFYMHVRYRKITFLFEIWIFWVGRARETTNQVEVA